ncbi:Transamidase GatB domain protein [hydrothermal vent metagenome]|uniref:Transamidase GatB domain protein n=1 Tax=hydrothermal vent metagenome TaxID=652676 RepID=A0A3B1D342_9ZZZZ
MLEDQITKDYIIAMKAKDSLKSSTLNFLRAQLKNVKIDKKLEVVDDMEAIAVIKKQVKQRQDSIEQFTQGGRQDLVDKETVELEILKVYLPEELPEEEVNALVMESIKEVGAASMKDMGKVMKVIGLKVEGCADNRKVSALVKKALMEL